MTDLPENNQSLADPGEFIVLEEQSVKHISRKRPVERGALILTNKRLVFVAAKDYDEINPFTSTRLENRHIVNLVNDPGKSVGAFFSLFAYARIFDAREIPNDPSSMTTIPLSSIRKVEGKMSFVKKAKLKVMWCPEGNNENEDEFQKMSEKRRSDLPPDINDWAGVIEKMKSGSLSYVLPASVPNTETLDGKIYYLLGDMQEKGVLEIMRELRERFDIELSEDEIKSACFKLAGERLVEYHREEGSSYDIVLETFRKYTPIELNLTE